MSLRLEEIPYEYKGKTYRLRCNMAVLEAVQDDNDGDLVNIISGNPYRAITAFLAAMLNDYADEMGWEERVTPKELSRTLSPGEATRIGVLGLVTRGMAPPKAADSSETDPAEQPDGGGN